MITIKECDEPLVDLKQTCPKLIIDLDPSRLKREKTAYLRETVARMLNNAQKQLPRGMTFIIGDAWRPRSVQEKIYREFIRWFTRHHPQWSAARVQREVQKYVAAHSGPYASGHMTGGAVDLRLWYRGHKVPMKSKALMYQENALSRQPKLPPHIQRNRRLLFEVLSAVGLSNYPKEYWHWSYGDIWWAKRTNKKVAIYGIVKHPPKNG